MKKLPRNVLPIVEMGDPALRNIAQSVMDLDDPSFVRFIPKLLATSGYYKCMGISAPQVRIGMRVIVISPRPTEWRPEVKRIEPIVMVNPRIAKRSDGRQEDYEGCFSFPGVFALVCRYKWITVTYVNEAGKRFTRRFSGFVARIIQHEIDHLDGIMFCDNIRGDQLISTAIFKERTLERRR
jgi:peptide deformylase